MASPHIFLQPAWPKHEDGRPKKMREMSRAEQDEQTRAACERLRAKFETESHQRAVARALKEHRT